MEPKMKHLDITRFEQQVGGNPALMVRIAQAFLGQLQGWQADFLAAKDQPERLGALLHKMKGSCHAVTAAEAANTCAQTEKALQLSGKASDLMLSNVLALIAELEAELSALIKQHDRGDRAAVNR